MKNFENYRFRASQIHNIMGGTIGLTEKQYGTMVDYEERHELAKAGQAKPLTANQFATMKELRDKHNNPELPKTMQTELKKIFLAEKYDRNFPFTNAYVQKGIHQEEEGITVFQTWLKKFHGKNVLFTKNKERLFNDWVQGEPDLGPYGQSIKNWKEGFDIKCPWWIKTMPLSFEELDAEYECQNQTYMWLTGAEKWHTVHTLVNSTEHQLNLEKQKFFYAYDSPVEPDDPFYDEMIQTQRDVEKMYICDYDRFKERHPFHDLIISREEWMDMGWDIPLEERVVVRTSIASEEWRSEAKKRIKLAKEYLTEIENKNGIKRTVKTEA